MVWLVQNPSLHVAHGLTITALAVLMALPLPIPFTNLAAYPILAFGFGILEDDGFMVALAYLLRLFCFSFFIALAWFGKTGLSMLINKM
jgi:hypothetical protein